MPLRHLTAMAAISSLAIAAPALAQEEQGGMPETQQEPAEQPSGRFDIDMTNSVFDDNYIMLGVGVAINPSYTGSDDYAFNVLPLVQGSLLGVDINPRAAGVKLDFLTDPDEGVGLEPKREL